MTERLLTARELADLLSLKPATVLDKWERGELPGFKIGRAVRFDPNEILAMTRRESAARGRAGAGGEAPATPQRPPEGVVSLRQQPR